MYISIVASSLFPNLSSYEIRAKLVRIKIKMLRNIYDTQHLTFSTITNSYNNKTFNHSCYSLPNISVLFRIFISYYLTSSYKAFVLLRVYKLNFVSKYCKQTKVLKYWILFQ